MLTASGFGVGYAPVAPGTVGSAAALAAGYGLLAIGWPVLAAAALLATVAGFWSVRAAAVQDDPGWVVMDEVAGQWIALLALSRPDPLGAAAAFALFRILDILKPGPVGWADRLDGPAGIMLDDLLAGLLAAAVILLARVAGLL